MSRLLLYALIAVAAAAFVLEAIALIQGVDGTRFAATMGVLGAIVGFIGRSLIKREIGK